MRRLTDRPRSPHPSPLPTHPPTHPCRIPKALGYATTLETLNLGTNKLTGKVPNRLSKLSALSDLNLASNSLSGSLSSRFCNLPSGAIVYGSGNKNSLCHPSCSGGPTFDGFNQC